MKKFFPLIQQLHLYTGLFISPFLILFGVSVLVINHPGTVNHITPERTIFERKLKLDKIPYDTSDLATGKAINQLLGISGEVDYVFPGKDKLSIRVISPGVETNIKVNTINDSVYVKQECKGALRGAVYLHKMPGPHLAKFRKNTVVMKAWSILTDMTVYLILFLSVTGIFLWYFLKAERTMGVYALVFGLLVFIVFIFAIIKN